jgi:hypothetical protein
LKKYTIDAVNNDKYFIVLDDNKEVCKISKAVNTLESVIKLVGQDNIKEVRK